MSPADIDILKQATVWADVGLRTTPKLILGSTPKHLVGMTCIGFRKNLLSWLAYIVSAEDFGGLQVRAMHPCVPMFVFNV